MKNTLIITLLIGLSSCQSIIKVMYGIKKPKVENEKTLTKYMTKKGIRQDNVYTVDFANYESTLKIINSTIPEVFIFNKNGQFIPYGEEQACNASAFNFIELLNDTTVYKTSDKASLKTTLLGLCDLNGQSKTINSLDATDFYIFIYWTRWSGKLNKDHVKVWEEQALNNNKTNIEIFKVNMDFQEYWGEDNLNKIKPKKE